MSIKYCIILPLSTMSEIEELSADAVSRRWFQNKRMWAIMYVGAATLMIIGIVVGILIYEVTKEVSKSKVTFKDSYYLKKIDISGRSGLNVYSTEDDLPKWANFSDAEKFCNAIKKHLVLINDHETEVAVVENIVLNTADVGCTDGYWLGARKNLLYQWHFGSENFSAVEHFLPVLSDIFTDSAIATSNGHCLQFESDHHLLQPIDCKTKASCFICAKPNCNIKAKMQDCFASFYMGELVKHMIGVTDARKVCKRYNLTLAIPYHQNILQAFKRLLHNQSDIQCKTIGTRGGYLLDGHYRLYLETIHEIPIEYELQHLNIKASNLNKHCLKVVGWENPQFVTENCSKELCYLCQRQKKLGSNSKFREEIIIPQPRIGLPKYFQKNTWKKA